ncbi:hypothetical protein [Marinobacterium aestuariivivens]|uniref:Uncharacterized protein n=1 Tax=Marinobacterium aestuariivivens TaxID=1698799 RepID=A0ABW2A509_9GAMM
MTRGVRQRLLYRAAESSRPLPSTAVSVGLPGVCVTATFGFVAVSRVLQKLVERDARRQAAAALSGV